MKDLEHARAQVQSSVDEILRPDSGTSDFDVDVATGSILKYVFHKQSLPGEADRYEWFYARLGLAVSIAQGWKKNIVPTLKSAADVEPSILRYIRDTYGVNFADYP